MWGPARVCVGRCSACSVCGRTSSWRAFSWYDLRPLQAFLRFVNTCSRSVLSRVMQTTQAPYDEMAAKDKVRYADAMKAYKASGAAGGGEAAAAADDGDDDAGDAADDE